jgi:demethylmenaquinone methyltransferase/2-methoxy-6-polyprenyl-1,4-benzoquinol methylase
MSRPGPAYAADAHRYDARTGAFTTYRRQLIDLMPIAPGDVVFDVGCGTGMCLPLLHERVGPGGRIIGIEPAPDMVQIAAARVAEHGWRNVTLIDTAAADADLDGLTADHALLCAVHDLLQSREALDHVLARARPGGSVAAGGGKWAAPWAVGFNLAIWATHEPYVRDFTGFGQPWAVLAERVEHLRVREVALGAGYLAIGTASRQDEPARDGHRCPGPGQDRGIVLDPAARAAGDPVAADAPRCGEPPSGVDKQTVITVALDDVARRRAQVRT